MADLSSEKSTRAKPADLERELHLKQLQINRLLNITQAINNNLSSVDLFKMYNSFLSWEMGVKKMALYIRSDDQWDCTTFIGLDKSLSNYDVAYFLPSFTRLKNLDFPDHPFLREFDIVIPVHHKEEAIAYTFIGGLEDSDDMYNRVQFIITITNIIAVAIENKRLFKRQLEQERLKREMELASEMQRLLVPSNLPAEPHMEVSSIYRPQISVGGDYFDFIPVGENKTAVCIADISGKGVAAALLMANFQANLRSLLNMPYDLSEFIRALNQAVFRITQGDRFITFFIAIYDKGQSTIKYINAGHVPPVLLTSDSCEKLTRGCTFLGSFNELPFVEVGNITVSQSALLVAFTDGITDVIDKNGAYFSEALLVNFAEKHRHASAANFNDALLKSINSFNAASQFPDDFTVITTRINPGL